MLNINNNEWLIVDGCVKEHFGTSEDVVIPDGVISFDENFSFKLSYTYTYFNKGVGIKSLTIPGSVGTIPKNFVVNYELLTKVTLEEGISVIGGNAFKNTNISEIIMPSSLRSVGYSAFTFNHNLKKVILNDGLEKIGDLAFYDTNLKEVYLPTSLNDIGNDAFNPNTTLICHFKTFLLLKDSINKKKNIYCKVIVDNDFDIDEVKEMLDNSNLHVTFYNYYNKRELKKLRKISDFVNMEEDNYLVDDKVITRKEPLIVDAEISSLVNEIREKTNVFEEKDKQAILTKLDSLINKYLKDLKALEPSYQSLSSNDIKLTIADTPATLKAKLLSELNVMLLNFTRIESYTSLKEKIIKYREIINNNETFNFDNISKKISEVMTYKDNIPYLNEILIEILDEIEVEIMRSSSDVFNLAFNFAITIDYDTILENKINEVCGKAILANNFFKALSRDASTNLGQDLVSLEAIIKSLDTNNCNIYKERFYSIINGYTYKAMRLKVDNNTERNLREELQPLIEELSTLVPNIVNKTELLSDLCEAKSLLTSDNNKPLGAISGTVKDIMEVLSNSLVNEDLKKDIITSISSLLDSSYQSIMQDSFILHENEITSSLSWNQQVSIQILKGLYDIKFNLEKYLNELRSYNEAINYKL
ncbi:MAG: leucine-rich repeat protein [Ruminococcus sp.]|nr:leucine-rich repeat protein [Ruminococcus sp.]